MRRGYTITEMLVLLAILGVLAWPLSRVSKVVMYDIPRSYKFVESNSSILLIMQMIKKDVNCATALSKKEGNNLLIEQRDKKINYAFEDGQIVRTENENTEEKSVFTTPLGKINCSIWEKDGKSYAVEINKYIELKRHTGIDKRMENSYVFFIGALPEERQ